MDSAKRPTIVVEFTLKIGRGLSLSVKPCLCVEGELLGFMIPVINDWAMRSQVPELIKEFTQNSTNRNVTPTVANTHSALMLFAFGLNSYQGS